MSAAFEKPAVPAVARLQDAEALAGTAGAVELLAAVAAVSNDTVFRFGGDGLDEEPMDGRDYSAMASIVEAAISTHFVDAGPAHGRGFALALADLLSIMADGMGNLQDWQPAKAVADAYEVARAHAR